MYFSVQGKVAEIFQGEMFIRILPTTLLEIFSEKILNLQVMVKIIKDPDDNFSKVL